METVDCWRGRVNSLSDFPLFLQQENPGANIISLGIGDTTQPIPDHILSGLIGSANKLGVKETYSGYGSEQGMAPLREKISKELYKGRIKPDEVFVSDGSKCDIARLQMMFGSQVVTAVQDPSYPVYVDTSVMMGQTGTMNKDRGQFDNIVYMPCNPGNDWCGRSAAAAAVAADVAAAAGMATTTRRNATDTTNDKSVLILNLSATIDPGRWVHVGTGYRCGYKQWYRAPIGDRWCKQFQVGGRRPRVCVPARACA